MMEGVIRCVCCNRIITDRLKSSSKLNGCLLCYPDDYYEATTTRRRHSSHVLNDWVINGKDVWSGRCWKYSKKKCKEMERLERIRRMEIEEEEKAVTK
jgi:hypothetical protein